MDLSKALNLWNTSVFSKASLTEYQGILDTPNNLVKQKAKILLININNIIINSLE